MTSFNAWIIEYANPLARSQFIHAHISAMRWSDRCSVQASSSSYNAVYRKSRINWKSPLMWKMLAIDYERISVLVASNCTWWLHEKKQFFNLSQFTESAYKTLLKKTKVIRCELLYSWAYAVDRFYRWMPNDVLFGCSWTERSSGAAVKQILYRGLCNILIYKFIASSRVVCYLKLNCCITNKHECKQDGSLSQLPTNILENVDKGHILCSSWRNNRLRETCKRWCTEVLKGVRVWRNMRAQDASHKNLKFLDWFAGSFRRKSSFNHLINR